MQLLKTELLIIHPDLLHLSSSRLSLSDFPHCLHLTTYQILPRAIHTSPCAQFSPMPGHSLVQIAIVAVTS